MTSHVHAFEGFEGGTFRVSLTYDAPTQAGKTAAHTDTYHGHFAELVPNERVVEVLEFETSNPALRGEMTITVPCRRHQRDCRARAPRGLAWTGSPSQEAGSQRDPSSRPWPGRSPQAATSR